jgi:hypothetical protein
MRRGFAGMAVRVNMHGAVAMAVLVEMHAVAPQPPQHVSAETHQHDADRRLERPCQAFGDRPAEQDSCAREHEQRQRMAEPPGQAVPDDVADVGAARGDAGHRGDMIGLERVLHTEQKPEA